MNRLFWVVTDGCGRNGSKLWLSSLARLSCAGIAPDSRLYSSSKGLRQRRIASRVTGEAASINATLVGVAVLSPVTDLTLSGATYETRADADPQDVLGEGLKRPLRKNDRQKPYFG